MAVRPEFTVPKRCACCGRLFLPLPQNYAKQEYCDLDDCRKAAEDASRAKWRDANPMYNQQPKHAIRVRCWRLFRRFGFRLGEMLLALREFLDCFLQAVRKTQDLLDHDFSHSSPVTGRIGLSLVLDRCLRRFNVLRERLSETPGSALLEN